MSFPGPSQVGAKYTKKTAPSGMKEGPLSGVPSVSSRPSSLGQVLLGSWPWEGLQRSDKDDVQSVRDSPAGQTPHDGTLPEEFSEICHGAGEAGEGRLLAKSQGHFASVSALWVMGTCHRSR